jgi:hypothetical protein
VLSLVFQTGVVRVVEPNHHRLGCHGTIVSERCV